VQISPEPEPEVKTTVRPDGMISIVLIGDVRAGGLTPEEIAGQIESLMGEYRLFPVVTVSVLAARSPTITVLGEVNSPGRIFLERETHLADAIAMSGGATDLAAGSRVRLVRREGGVTRTYIANLDEIREGDNSTNTLLQSGDLVTVPPATPVGVGYAIRRALYPFEVVLGTLTRIIFFFL
jgi:polysaccharide export outer membrane protein